MKQFWVLAMGLLVTATASFSSGYAQLSSYLNIVDAEATAGAGAVPPLNFPTDMAFTPDGTMLFVTEKGSGSPARARVRVYDLQPDGLSYALRAQPFVDVSVSLLSGYHERGLTSIAVDSYYPFFPYVYLYRTALNASGQPVLRISRFEDLGGGVGGNGVILRDFPLLNNTHRHVAAKLRHNPYDFMLYIAIGDNNVPARAQSLSQPHGKVHRINPYDGSVPEDNPFPGSSVWAYGLRHLFAISVNPFTGELYGVDNGENCDDRAMKIVPGQNYRWGLAPTPNCPFSPSVIWRSGTAPGNQVSPAGLTFLWYDFYTGFFPGDMLFGEWNTGDIRRITLFGDALDQGTPPDRFYNGTPTSTGRITAVEQAPNGYVYFTSCIVSAMFPTGCPAGASRLFRLNP